MAARKFALALHRLRRDVKANQKPLHPTIHSEFDVVSPWYKTSGTAAGPRNPTSVSKFLDSLFHDLAENHPKRDACELTEKHTKEPHRFFPKKCITAARMFRRQNMKGTLSSSLASALCKSGCSCNQTVLLVKSITFIICVIDLVAI